jgi:hypothetical protein
MRRHDVGPRRSAPVYPYLRETRLLAALAVAGLAAGAASDVAGVRFWDEHPLLAGLTANVIVVLLSAAVLNEVLQSRSRRRWRVLAQYVMFELAYNARMIWIAVLEVADLLPSSTSVSVSLDAGGRTVGDSARLRAAIREVLSSSERRRMLYEELTHCASVSDELVGRWAAVMLDADAYAEVIDRHVELASDLAWLEGLVAESNPAADLRRRRARFNSAVQLERDVDDQWLADRVVTIAQLAEELDRTTFAAALRVVPVRWWESRLGTTVRSAELRVISVWDACGSREFIARPRSCRQAATSRPARLVPCCRSSSCQRRRPRSPPSARRSPTSLRRPGDSLQRAAVPRRGR